jgi:carbon-monoxide dehydrogenase medium subunit
MHPSSFEYFAPTKMEEALELLSKYGEDAKIMSGGQSLIPLLKLRIASFPYVIDISGVQGLNRITENKEFLEIGALTTISSIADSELIKKRYQILHEAAGQIADPLIRNRGTIGGNISHGDPSNDIPAVAIALKANLEVIGKEGKRIVEAHSFVTDSFTNVLKVGEILNKIRIPVAPDNSGGCYIKQKKSAGDFSVAAIAVQLSLHDNDSVKSAGIGLTSVAPKPTRAMKAERFLEGKKINDSVVREAAKIVVSESDPSTDFYGSSEFKRKVLGKIAEEAINLSFERATVR